MVLNVLKSRAEPPGLPVFNLLTRSVTSVISKTGSTSVWMRFQFAGAIESCDPLAEVVEGQREFSWGRNDYKQWIVGRGCGSAARKPKGPSLRSGWQPSLQFGAEHRDNVVRMCDSTSFGLSFVEKLGG